MECHESAEITVSSPLKRVRLKLVHNRSLVHQDDGIWHRWAEIGLEPRCLATGSC